MAKIKCTTDKYRSVIKGCYYDVRKKLSKSIKVLDEYGELTTLKENEYKWEG